MKLIFVAAGVVVLLAGGATLTWITARKPWGVPDEKREFYEEKVAEFKSRNSLKRELATQPKPVASAFAESKYNEFWNPDEIASFDFKIRNDGQEPLTLRITGTTGQAIGALGRDTLAPGEETLLSLTRPTRDARGEFLCSATVATNDPFKPSLEFEARGKIKSDFVVPDKVGFPPIDLTERANKTFLIYSQIHSAFEIEGVACELSGFGWLAEPVLLDSDAAESIANQRPLSIWRVHIWTDGMEYGRYADSLKITLRPADNQGDDDPHIVDIECFGRVRAPIVFHSPDIHITRGLEIGVLESGTEHSFHLLARLRGIAESREIDVLAVEPKVLDVSLAPLKTAGDYRLTITIPADCPPTIFNNAEHHGYVSVGDPNDDRFSNWFPVYGAVVERDVEAQR